MCVQGQSGGGRGLGLLCGVPGVLLLVASMHDITHRRVAVSPLDAFLVLGLALVPLLMWALKMITALRTVAAAASRGGSHAQVNIAPCCLPPSTGFNSSTCLSAATSSFAGP